MNAPASATFFSSRRPRTGVTLRQMLIALAMMTLLAGCREVSSREPAPAVRPDARNTTYVLGAEPVTLVDGAADEPGEAGASGRVLTRIWGDPTRADMDGDGIDDAVLILTRATGGSGTFYFLAAAIGSPGGQVGTKGLLLGDRIEPKTIDVQDGKASVRFMTRGPDASFADAPTIERTRDFLYDPDQQEMVEVAHDFEGEADPDRMTLDMKTWTWIKTEYNNDTTREPVQKDAFTLTFADGQVQGTTDCNSFTGRYTVDGHKIDFDERVAMTRMFCPDSQETEFVAMLLETTSYLFTGQGRLVLELKYDSGGMHFR